MSKSAALRDKIMEAVLDEKYDGPYQDGDDILITICLGTVADDGELMAKGGDEG